MKKKAVSIIMAVIMCLGFIGVFEPTMVSANTMPTQEEAVAWARAQGEQRVRHVEGNRYGAQCVAFTRAYLRILWGAYQPRGHAITLAGHHWPAGWTYIPAYAGMIPQPGDIFITRGVTHHGHVGIVLESTATHATIADQNATADWNLTVGAPAAIRNITWGTNSNHLVGIVRPLFAEPGIIMYVNRANAPLRPNPYQNSGETRRLQIGTQIRVVESMRNSHNNLWHRLIDGGWIYSGNVSTPTTMFVARNNAPYRPEPYARSGERGRLNTGASISVLRSTVNTENNRWYLLTNGNWMYSGNLSLTRPNSAPENGTFVISSVATPSHRLNVRSYKPPARGNNVTIAPSYTSRLGSRYISTSTWRLERDGDAWIIWSSTPNINLNAARNVSAINGTNVNVWNWVAENTQRWIIQDRGNGQFSIASQSNPYVVLAVTGARDSIEQYNVTMAYFNGCLSQLWTFSRQ